MEENSVAKDLLITSVSSGHLSFCATNISAEKHFALVCWTFSAFGFELRDEDDLEMWVFAGLCCGEGGGIPFDEDDSARPKARGTVDGVGVESGVMCAG